MNWNDYEAVWRRQPLPLGAMADLATIKETFEAKRRKMAATLFVRDIAEASAGIVVCVVFAFFWWQQGAKGWPIGLAIALTLGVTLSFVRERIRANRYQIGEEAPMLAKLEADMAELRHQRRLLLNVWKWYLAPLGAAGLIVLANFLFRAPAWALTLHLLFLAGFLPVFGFTFWFAWKINRRAVRQRIEPRLLELEKLRSELLAP